MTCYLVEYTLYSFHVRFIYPFSFQSLIGVVGIDIALSELLQNTVVSKHYFPSNSKFYALHFNYSFTKVSASFNQNFYYSRLVPVNCRTPSLSKPRMAELWFIPNFPNLRKFRKSRW